MRLLILATSILAWTVEDGMQHAFYPVLLLVLLSASLGVPIPEDVPLIAAGVILSHQTGIATWPATLFVALLGVMCGDVVLFVLGKRWGPEVFEHRWVKWLITPQRLQKMTEKFSRHGMWMCFFGRFFIGVRAGMCITAGVTRFPFWRFFLADLTGAMLSVPLLVWLGYWFANAVPTIKAYVHLVQWGMLGLAIVGFALFVLLRRRRRPESLAVSADTSRPQQVTVQQSSPVEAGSLGKPSKQRLAPVKAKSCP